MFFAAAVVTATGVLTLGRNFAVFPAVRGIVVGGPYRLVKHPIYAGELLLILAMFTAGPTLLTLLVFVASIPCFAGRVLAEEWLLRDSIEYQQCLRRIGWRLMPGV
jgi:protein-S-isoprenylcysteine O-methyltransferase Ste14